MEGCGGKDEQSNLFKGNNDTGSIIVLISLQSKPTRSVDKVFVCRSRDHNSKSMVINPPPQSWEWIIGMPFACPSDRPSVCPNVALSFPLHTAWKKDFH